MTKRQHEGDRNEHRPEGATPEGPAKKHGDALAEGSGTRHGVSGRTERPETAPDEGVKRG